mmetsp:Transcript_34115/g.53298  ORF Transcript_34115/g.53298 Transcript_34115/m.53298 type:complete len:159 (+) Transcript_34115:413-889(+)
MRCCGGLKSERQRQQRRGRSRALKATVRRVKGALAKEVERPAGLNLLQPKRTKPETDPGGGTDHDSDTEKVRPEHCKTCKRLTSTVSSTSPAKTGSWSARAKGLCLLRALGPLVGDRFWAVFKNAGCIYGLRRYIQEFLAANLEVWLGMQCQSTSAGS